MQCNLFGKRCFVSISFPCRSPLVECNVCPIATCSFVRVLMFCTWRACHRATKCGLVQVKIELVASNEHGSLSTSERSLCSSSHTDHKLFLCSGTAKVLSSVLGLQSCSNAAEMNVRSRSTPTTQVIAPTLLSFSTWQSPLISEQGPTCSVLKVTGVETLRAEFGSVLPLPLGAISNYCCPFAFEAS